MCQELIDLLVVNGKEGLLPFPALLLEKDLLHFTEYISGEGIVFEGVERLFEGRGEEGDAILLQLGPSHLVDVCVDRFAGVEFFLNSVKTGGKVHRRGEVGIVRHVGCTILDAVTVERESKHSGSIVSPEGDENGSPTHVGHVSLGDESLVAVVGR